MSYNRNEHYEKLSKLKDISYRKLDVVTDEFLNVGYISEVSYNVVQFGSPCQIQYDVNWIFGFNNKRAWFNHDELIVHTNLLYEFSLDTENVSKFTKKNKYKNYREEVDNRKFYESIKRSVQLCPACDNSNHDESFVIMTDDCYQIYCKNCNFKITFGSKDERRLRNLITLWNRM